MQKRLTNTELVQLSPFLKSGAVRPGDVLLTRGRGGESTLIAAVTGGQFSHAALWLPVPDSPLPALIEAEDLGVGFTTLTPIHFMTGSTVTSTYSLPQSPLAWKLMRHPAIAGIAPERLIAASEAFLKKVLHRRYSALERLVKPVGLPAPIESIAGRLGAFADRLSRAQGHHGIFCSELVALYFEELQVSLFKSGGPAATHVSPNDLDSGICLLKCVEDAFLAPDSLGTDFEATRTELEWLARKDVVPVFVKNRHDGDVLMRVVGELRQVVHDAFTAQMTRSEQLALSIYEQMRTQAAETAERGHTRYAEKFSSQAALALLLLHLERQIAAHYKRMQDAPRDKPTPEAPGQALQILARTRINLSTENQSRNLRTATLYALKIMQIRLDDSGLSRKARAELTRKRRELIDGWRSHRKEKAQTLQRTNALLQPKPASAETLEYVNEVIGKAQSAALAQSGVSDAAISPPS